MDVKKPFLVIPDLQMPFEHPSALRFCKEVASHYRVPKENILNVGDELDLFHGSSYPKTPEAMHTPKGEIAHAREKIREWASVFPQMKLAISNHGTRWLKRASQAEIPQELMRTYQEIFNTPEGWQWKDEWIIKTKHPFRMIHGVGYSGMNGHRTASLDAGMSLCMGHLHSHAGIAYIRTGRQKLWAMNAGSLIDSEAYAFNYGKDSRFKSCLGVGLVLREGSTPIWIPID